MKKPEDSMTMEAKKMSDKKEDLIENRRLYRERLIRLNKNSMKNIPFDLSRIFPLTENTDELIAQVDDLKKCLDSFRPLQPNQVENLSKAFDIEYTYESNRIEGNTLTLSETALVIQSGITVKGKPLKDHLEAVNHNEALGYVKEFAQKRVILNDSELRKIHGIILEAINRDEAGRYRRDRVMIMGSRHVPPNPLKLDELMKDYFNFYEQNREKLHPVILASDMHERLVKIHPFLDGNGRTARLVMNLILMQDDFPIANISGAKEQRDFYCDSLEIAHTQDDSSQFRKLVLREVKRSLINYLNMVATDEDEDRGDYFFQRIGSALR